MKWFAISKNWVNQVAYYFIVYIWRRCVWQIDEWCANKGKCSINERDARMIPRRAPSCTLPKADHVFPLFQCLLATCMTFHSLEMAALSLWMTTASIHYTSMFSHRSGSSTVLHWISMEQFCCELLLVSSELRTSYALVCCKLPSDRKKNLRPLFHPGYSFSTVWNPKLVGR